ncbi:MAG TPA: hypothetical protein PLD62_02320, partial [Candidatus Cloacimonadota bacterium]|nr:hypothetical protein [Candidatus Cloacimonadota bacterium]
MKLNPFKSGSCLILLVFGFLLIPFSSHAAVNYEDCIVQNLQTHDIPNDDGSGLMISWKPLPKEKRIIEYRVYRGITPDSLFYIGKIDVNATTGVMGDEMFFYDTDYNYFLDTQASAKLHHEKGQEKGSPLYKRYPRDIDVVGPQLENYSILSIIDEKSLYYRTKKIEVPDEDGEDSKVYAGLKLHNFIQLAKKLLPDHEYYYTIVAVNESRKYYPHAEPVVGIPRENAPEKLEEFYAVFVQDMQRLQFEWNLANFTDDHWHHSIYMLSQKDLPKFEQYLSELKEKEQNDLAIKEGTTTTVYEPKTENPAQLIFRRGSGYPYTPNKTAFIDIKDDRIVDEDNQIDVAINTGNIDDYLFVFSFDDYAGYESFSTTKAVEKIDSSDLPSIPDFMVRDNPDDKGDYNLVKWGKPTVYITNSSYYNEAKTKLLVNYEFKTNEDYKVRNILFTVYDDNGNKIDYVNEFYQDKKIIIHLPENASKEQTLNFEMTFKCNNPLPDDYKLTQILKFDPQARTLVPGKVYLGNEDLNKYNYYVFKINYNSEEFRLSKKIAGTERELSDNIRNDISTFKVLTEYDAEKDLYLFSPTFSLTNDVSANLYASETEKTKKRYTDEIAKYTAMKDTLETDADLANADAAIEYYNKQLTALNDDPILKQADSYSSYNSRIHYLSQIRRYATRSFGYKIVKSDGMGHFVESEVLVLDKPVADQNLYSENLPAWGTEYFMPHSNWFDRRMLPTLIASVLFGYLVFLMINKAKKGKDLYVRPIAGIQEIDNAIGRATEMGKPILFVPGTSGINKMGLPISVARPMALSI